MVHHRVLLIFWTLYLLIFKCTVTRSLHVLAIPLSCLCSTNLTSPLFIMIQNQKCLSIYFFSKKIQFKFFLVPLLTWIPNSSYGTWRFLFMRFSFSSGEREIDTDSILSDKPFTSMSYWKKKNPVKLNWTGTTLTNRHQFKTLGADWVVWNTYCLVCWLQFFCFCFYKSILRNFVFHQSRQTFFKSIIPISISSYFSQLRSTAVYCNFINLLFFLFVT